jgi:hypothetical protein
MLRPPLAPGESVAHIESPDTPSAEDSPPTGHQTQSSSRTDINKDFLVTVKAEDASDGDVEDTEDDWNNSNCHAEMGCDDESASDWDPTDYGQCPESNSLVYLGMLRCKIPTQVKAKNGSKLSCVCGKLQAGCKRHEEKISQGAYRGQIGYYIAMSDPARGFQGHRKLAFFYTNG